MIPDNCSHDYDHDRLLPAKLDHDQHSIFVGRKKNDGDNGAVTSRGRCPRAAAYYHVAIELYTPAVRAKTEQIAFWTQVANSHAIHRILHATIKIMVKPIRKEL